MSSADLPAEYQTAEGLRTLGNYLRSQNGVKARPGIEHEKRVDYFKGDVRSTITSSLKSDLNVVFCREKTYRESSGSQKMAEIDSENNR